MLPEKIRVLAVLIRADAARLSAKAVDRNGARDQAPDGRYCSRIDRRRTLADLEVQLRRRHAAGLPRLGDHLTATDLVVALDHEFARMRIGGDETVGVAHQDEIAVALQLVARIGHDAVLGRPHRSALGNREIDAVTLLTIGFRPEAGDHPASHRPAKGRRSSAGRCTRIGGCLRAGGGDARRRYGLGARDVL